MMEWIFSFRSQNSAAEMEEVTAEDGSMEGVSAPMSFEEAEKFSF